jgi:hypothetical protein
MAPPNAGAAHDPIFIHAKSFGDRRVLDHLLRQGHADRANGRTRDLAVRAQRAARRQYALVSLSHT